MLEARLHNYNSDYGWSEIFLEEGGHAKYHLADHMPIIYILIITFFFEAPGKAIFAQKTILIILFGSLGYPKYTIKLL